MRVLRLSATSPQIAVTLMEGSGDAVESWMPICRSAGGHSERSYLARGYHFALATGGPEVESGFSSLRRRFFTVHQRVSDMTYA